MKKIFLFSLFFLIITIINSCSKSEESVPVYTFQGTVYLKGKPAEGVSVEAGYREIETHSGQNWYDVFGARTDSNGKYKFTLKSKSGETKGWRWHARAKNPETGIWTEWINGRVVPPGGSDSIDFYF